jgi:hypothetical protein
MPVVSLATTPDGGVLAAAAGFDAFSSSQPVGAVVTKLAADGTSTWTLGSGGQPTNARIVAAGATGFVLSGTSSGSSDFNSGAGVDIVFGDVTFLSRYTY